MAQSMPTAAFGPAYPMLTAKLCRQSCWWTAQLVGYADSPNKKPLAQNIVVGTLWRSRSAANYHIVLPRTGQVLYCRDALYKSWMGYIHSPSSHLT
jgi:hypothetical protein